MFSRLIISGAVVLALWMSAGRWLFGIGGWITWWYLPTIGLVYVLGHLWLVRRMRITDERGKKTSRGTGVSLALSWVLAVAFGFTAPDMHDGALETIISLAGSDVSRELAIALCNPFGILTMVGLGSAIGFAINDSKDPNPEDFEEYDGPIEMPKHPLS